MAFKDDLQAAVKDIYSKSWTTRKGRVVPAPEDLSHGNEGVELEGAVLYADLDGSTNLVDQYKPTFAAEIYKAYLVCAARIIKAENGVITAYDGDRVMGVFIGESPCNDAARCALKINHAVSKIINPLLKDYADYTVKHTIGVDFSKLMAARIGVRNDNDLVWVGRAANYAAKLTTFGGDSPALITGDVFDRLQDKQKYGGDPARLMWTEKNWGKMNNMRVYASNWSWTP